MSRREKRKSGSFGSFVFGSFFGFLLCIGALVGIGCFAYFKVSPAWINKTFNTNIDLGNEEINDKTLKDLVSGTVGLVKNVDTYTLSDLKKDFGIEIEDELFGIDIADLKSVALTDLPQAIEDKFGSISADELRNVNGMNLDDMSKILDKSNTYYYNLEDNKLYNSFNGTSYSSPVNFDYEVNEAKTKVITKKHENAIVLNQEHGVVNKVDIQLWYLPLSVALSDFTSNMGDQITLKELETDYGVQLPSFLDNIDKQNTTINELEDAINGLYVADFLGYTIDDSNPANIVVKDGNQQEVTGLMYELAIEKVEGLKNIEDKFSSLTAEDLEDTMDLSSLDKIFNKSNTYYYNGTKLYDESTYETEVDFDYEISGSNVIVEGESFGISGGKVEITLKYLPLATAIADFTSNMGDKLTLQELKQDYGVNLPDYIYNNNEAKTINEIETIIDNVYVADILGYTIDGENVKDGEEIVTGVMGIIAKKKVSELNDIQSTIEAQTIATLLDYTVTTDDSDPDNIITTVTDKQGNTITGLLAKLAPYTIKNADSAIDSLTLSDVFDSTQLSSGVFKLLDQSKVGTLKVVNVAQDLQDAIEISSMADLQEAGLIDGSYDLEVQIDTDEDGVKDSLMSSLTLNEFIDIALSVLTK